MPGRDRLENAFLRFFRTVTVVTDIEGLEAGEAQISRKSQKAAKESGWNVQDLQLPRHGQWWKDVIYLRGCPGTVDNNDFHQSRAGILGYSAHGVYKEGVLDLLDCVVCPFAAGERQPADAGA